MYKTLNKSLALLLSLAMVLTMLPFTLVTASAEEWKNDYGGYFQNRTNASNLGVGTKNSPYIVQDVDELEILAIEVNGTTSNTAKVKDSNKLTSITLTQSNFDGAYFKLKTDFDKTTALTTSIGSKSKPFNGNFNGNDQTIYLSIDQSNSSYAGLFGYTNSSSTTVIENLTVTGTVKSKYFMAGLVGYANNKIEVSKCTNVATIIGTDWYNEGSGIGGLVAHAENGITMTSCYNNGSMYGVATSEPYKKYDPYLSMSVGGMLGDGNGTITITDCHNTGNIDALSEAGGLVGLIGNGSDVIVSNSSNSGNITVTRKSGNVSGLVSWTGDNSSLKIYNSSNTGNISYKGESPHNGDVAGLAGDVSGYLEMINCYNKGAVSGGNALGGIVAEVEADCKLANCYNTGTLTADENTPDCTPYGICGCIRKEDSEVSVENCYYNNETGITQAFPDKEDSQYTDVDGVASDGCVIKDGTKTSIFTLFNAYIQDNPIAGEEGNVIDLSAWNVDKDGNPIFIDYDDITEITEAKIDLTIDAPQADQKLTEKAKLNSFTSTPDKTEVKVDDIYWQDEEEKTAKVAKCCGEYTAKIYVNLSTNDLSYKLTDNTKLNATVNGRQVEAERISTGFYSLTYTFDKLKHTWDNGKIVKNATKNHRAVRLFTCTVCQEGVKTEYLPQSKQTIKLLKKNYKAKNKTVKIKAKAKTGLRFRALKKSKLYKVTKNGKIKFTKKAKKGTYKIKVRITAKLNNSYKQAKTTKVIKVKVK